MFNLTAFKLWCERGIRVVEVNNVIKKKTPNGEETKPHGTKSKGQCGIQVFATVPLLLLKANNAVELTTFRLTWALNTLPFPAVSSSFHLELFSAFP